METNDGGQRSYQGFDDDIQSHQNQMNSNYLNYLANQMKGKKQTKKPQKIRYAVSNYSIENLSKKCKTQAFEKNNTVIQRPPISLQMIPIHCFNFHSKLKLSKNNNVVPILQDTEKQTDNNFIREENQDDEVVEECHLNEQNQPKHSFRENQGRQNEKFVRLQGSNVILKYTLNQSGSSNDAQNKNETINQTINLSPEEQFETFHHQEIKRNQLPLRLNRRLSSKIHIKEEDSFSMSKRKKSNLVNMSLDKIQYDVEIPKNSEYFGIENKVQIIKEFSNLSSKPNRQTLTSNQKGEIQVKRNLQLESIKSTCFIENRQNQDEQKRNYLLKKNTYKTFKNLENQTMSLYKSKLSSTQDFSCQIQNQDFQDFDSSVISGNQQPSNHRYQSHNEHSTEQSVFNYSQERLLYSTKPYKLKSFIGGIENQAIITSFQQDDSKQMKSNLLPQSTKSISHPIQNYKFQFPPKVFRDSHLAPITTGSLQSPKIKTIEKREINQFSDINQSLSKEQMNKSSKFFNQKVENKKAEEEKQILSLIEALEVGQFINKKKIPRESQKLFPKIKIENDINLHQLDHLLTIQ